MKQEIILIENFKGTVVKWMNQIEGEPKIQFQFSKSLILLNRKCVSKSQKEKKSKFQNLNNFRFWYPIKLEFIHQWNDNVNRIFFFLDLSDGWFYSFYLKYSNVMNETFYYSSLMAIQICQPYTRDIILHGLDLEKWHDVNIVIIFNDDN